MTQDLDALPLPVPTHFRNGVLYAFSADQIRAARREGYELAKREAQEGREQTTAQGKINAELDTDSNTSESQQRRHMAGSLEVGQLVGDRQDSRSGDIEPQGEKSLERWLYGIMKPIAEDIAKNCSTAPQLVIAPLIWGIEDLLKSGALFTSPPPKSDEARDAERYRVLRDFDSGKTELAICRWSEHGWVGEWVIEHDPDAAIDAAQQKGGAA